MRAVPFLASVVGVLIFRGGRGGGGGGGGDNAAAATRSPSQRPPPRRPARRPPADAAAARPARARVAAALALLCVLLSVAVCAAALWEQARLVLALATANALSAGGVAVLCLRGARKAAARERPRPAHGAVAPLEQQRLTEEQLAAVAPLYTGFWRKDAEASESMNEAMDLIQLHWLIRAAVNVITGLDLRLTPEKFDFVVRSRLKISVCESFLTSGEPRRHQRRDMRGGGALGRVAVTAAGISLNLEWGEPLAGAESMLFMLSPDHLTLTVRSRVVLLSGRECTYTQVYRKT